MGRRYDDREDEYYRDRDYDRGRRDQGGSGAGEVIAEAIRWIAIILVVLIIAYVVLEITGTIEGIFVSL